MSQMPKTVARIGPGDHGRRMSLDDFESAEGADGFLYELGRGAVTVVDVPDSQHLAQVDEIREQFYVYKRSNPGRIHRMGSGSDCKILLATSCRSATRTGSCTRRRPRPRPARRSCGRRGYPRS